jgi:hypothetical protein
VRTNNRITEISNSPHVHSTGFSRVIAEQTPGPVDLRTPAVASKFKSVAGAPSAVGEPLKVFLRVKPVDEANACFAITPDGKTLTANAPRFVSQ